MKTLRGQALRQSAVVAVKATSSSKKDMEEVLKETANITTICCHNNIRIIDIVFANGGIKDISKRIKEITQQAQINYLLIYEPKSIAISENEFMQFVADMRDFYGVEVKSVK